NQSCHESGTAVGLRPVITEHCRRRCRISHHLPGSLQVPGRKRHFGFLAKDRIVREEHHDLKHLRWRHRKCSLGCGAHHVCGHGVTLDLVKERRHGLYLLSLRSKPLETQASGVFPPLLTHAARRPPGPRREASLPNVAALQTARDSGFGSIPSAPDARSSAAPRASPRSVLAKCRCAPNRWSLRLREYSFRS